MVFTFFHGWGKKLKEWSYFVTHENYMTFKLYCSQINCVTDESTFLCLHISTAVSCYKSWVVTRDHMWHSYPFPLLHNAAQTTNCWDCHASKAQWSEDCVFQMRRQSNVFILALYWRIRYTWMWSKLLAFYCTITNYQKLNGLQQYTLISSQFLWITSLGTAQPSHLLRVSQASFKVSARLHLYLEADVGKISLPNPYRLRAEFTSSPWISKGPCFLLAPRWRIPSGPTQYTYRCQKLSTVHCHMGFSNIATYFFESPKRISSSNFLCKVK